MRDVRADPREREIERVPGGGLAGASLVCDCVSVCRDSRVGDRSGASGQQGSRAFYVKTAWQCVFLHIELYTVYRGTMSMICTSN